MAGYPSIFGDVRFILTLDKDEFSCIDEGPSIVLSAAHMLCMDKYEQKIRVTMPQLIFSPHV